MLHAEAGLYAMLIRKDYFKTFTNRLLPDGSTTQVLLALDVGSRARVEAV